MKRPQRRRMSWITTISVVALLVVGLSATACAVQNPPQPALENGNMPIESSQGYGAAPAEGRTPAVQKGSGDVLHVSASHKEPGPIVVTAAPMATVVVTQAMPVTAIVVTRVALRTAVQTAAVTEVGQACLVGIGQGGVISRHGAGCATATPVPTPSPLIRPTEIAPPQPRGGRPVHLQAGDQVLIPSKGWFGTSISPATVDSTDVLRAAPATGQTASSSVAVEALAPGTSTIKISPSKAFVATVKGNVANNCYGTWSYCSAMSAALTRPFIFSVVVSPAK